MFRKRNTKSDSTQFIESNRKDEENNSIYSNQNRKNEENIIVTEETTDS